MIDGRLIRFVMTPIDNAPPIQDPCDVWECWAPARFEMDMNLMNFHIPFGLCNEHALKIDVQMREWIVEEKE
jgi:hypothetical protein